MMNLIEHEYEIKCSAETKRELLEKYHISAGGLSQALNFKNFSFTARRIRADTVNNYPSKIVKADLQYLIL